MAINLTINGHKCDDSFLIAPDQSRTFPAHLGLSTDDGSTVNATLQVAPGGASIEFGSTVVTIGSAETIVELHATSASKARGDTVVQVLVDGLVQASCAFTAITAVKVWFKGRFQARFATAASPYNDPTGVGGFTFALEGEEPFVPVDSIPNIITKAVGRQVRFNNAVNPRPRVPPIGVQVTQFSGRVGGGTTEEEFTGGDSILGLPVNLGPNSYFAGNQPPKQGDPLPAEQHPDAFEPIALFEFHIGNQFSGKSLRPEDRPITFEDKTLEFLTPEQLTRFGIPALSVFNANRRRELQEDLDQMSPADQTDTVEGRNLQTRINRLTGTLRAGYLGREWFTGLINDAIQIDPQDSAVLKYLEGFNSFMFSAAFFNFHADELCGQVLGYISAAQGDPLDPFEPNAAAAPGVAAAPASRSVSRTDPSAPVPADIQDRL